MDYRKRGTYVYKSMLSHRLASLVTRSPHPLCVPSLFEPMDTAMQTQHHPFWASPDRPSACIMSPDMPHKPEALSTAEYIRHCMSPIPPLSPSSTSSPPDSKVSDTSEEPSDSKVIHRNLNLFITICLLETLGPVPYQDILTLSPGGYPAG